MPQAWICYSRHTDVFGLSQALCYVEDGLREPKIRLPAQTRSSEWRIPWRGRTVSSRLHSFRGGESLWVTKDVPLPTLRRWPPLLTELWLHPAVRVDDNKQPCTVSPAVKEKRSLSCTPAFIIHRNVLALDFYGSSYRGSILLSWWLL